MIIPQFTVGFGQMMMVISFITHRPPQIFVDSFSRSSVLPNFMRKRQLMFKSFVSSKDPSDFISQQTVKRKFSNVQRASIRQDKETYIQNGRRPAKPFIHNKNTTAVTTNPGSQASSSPSHTSPSPTVLLPDPAVIFSNNHLLIVNKPAGYHSQPNEAMNNNTTTTTTLSQKCLLTKLKQSQLGGGSQNDFLLPMHRLDQPCTGIILLAKTSKAGTRIGTAFRDKVILKEYLCVVMGSLETMIQNSFMIKEDGHDSTDEMQFYSEETTTPLIVGKKTRKISRNKNTFYRLSGVMEPKNISKIQKEGTSPSVSFKPLSKQYSQKVHTASESTFSNGGRICHLEWTYLTTISGGVMYNKNLSLKTNRPTDFMHLLLIKTPTGAKHQIRAMMAQLAKSPICGDLRYHRASETLPDQSVALHARSLFIPPNQVSLGETDLSHSFIAPIPSVWKDYFGLTEKDVKRILN